MIQGWFYLKRYFPKIDLNISFELSEFYKIEIRVFADPNFKLSFNICNSDTSTILTSNNGIWILDQIHQEFSPLKNIKDLEEFTYRINYHGIHFKKISIFTISVNYSFYYNPIGESLSKHGFLIKIKLPGLVSQTKQQKEPG